MTAKSWLRIIFFVLLFISGLVWWVWPKPPQPTVVVTPSGNIVPSKAPKALGNARTGTFRGFIKGGVRSLQDFSGALYADPDLAHLFAGFDFSSAVFETLARPQCFFIAYRSGPRTFAWTNECKILPKGTLILTDGSYLIRAACGNMLSIGPQAPVISPDLEPMTLDVPDAAPEPPTGLTALPQPSPTPVSVTPIGVTPYAPSVPIYVCCVSSPPVHVPDIGEWAALIFSVLFLAVFVPWRKR